jgi:hypothetical protein
MLKHFIFWNGVSTIYDLLRAAIHEVLASWKLLLAYLYFWKEFSSICAWTCVVVVGNVWFHEANTTNMCACISYTLESSIASSSLVRLA